MSDRAIRPSYALATMVLALCAQVNADAGPPTGEPATREIKVLGIGNSFTGNAFAFLPALRSRDAKCRVVLGRAIIGGCSMEKHMRLAKLHEAEPDDPKGKPYVRSASDARGKRTTIRVGLREMLTADNWDIVTIQQLSAQSTDIANYRPHARQLHDYIKRYAPRAEVVMHQTWAYRMDGDFNRVFPDKPSYGQHEMYRDLTAAYTAIAEELGVRLIPVGAAFQLAREYRPFIPDQTTDRSTLAPPDLPNDKNSLCAGWTWDRSKPPKLHCDTHHAGTRGKYLAAAVWFEFLTGVKLDAERGRPKGIARDEAKFLIDVAHKVVAEGKRPRIDNGALVN